MPKLKRRLSWICLLLLFVLWVTGEQWLPSIYVFLDTSEEPQNADWIIVLGGGYYRAERVAELYQAGYSDVIVLSGGENEKQRNIHYLVSVGIPSSAILELDALPTSTWDEAEFLLRMMNEHKIQSAIIVTDAYHIRRSQAVYNKQNESIVLYFVASRDIDQRETWWNNTLQWVVLRELPAIVYYWLAYGINPIA